MIAPSKVFALALVSPRGLSSPDLRAHHPQVLVVLPALDMVRTVVLRVQWETVAPRVHTPLLVDPVPSPRVLTEFSSRILSPLRALALSLQGVVIPKSSIARRRLNRLRPSPQFSRPLP